MAADVASTARTYDLAADHFDQLPFWHTFGERTVAALGLTPGLTVVDLCCGTGASALPAARAVGPTGRVTGVDISPGLIAVARTRAAQAGLHQATFECTDVTHVDQPPASVDAVIAVFGLFFVDDMPALLRRAWHWLAPGGAMAITTWGDQVLAPGEDWFWEAARREQPGIATAGHAARLNTPTSCARSSPTRACLNPRSPPTAGRCPSNLQWRSGLSFWAQATAAPSKHCRPTPRPASVPRSPPDSMPPGCRR